MKGKWKEIEVVVIGGGPAGMMAAISAAKAGNQVKLLEKNCSLGRKLLITGKGRCNITSSLEMNEFIENTPGNGRFLYSCFQQFTNQDIIRMLKENGLEVKQERGNRIFPVTDKAQSVLDCFEKELKKHHVAVKTNTQVAQICTRLDENVQKVVGVRCISGEKINADKIVLATGGKSYPRNRFYWRWLSFGWRVGTYDYPATRVDCAIRSGQEIVPKNDGIVLEECEN